MLSERPIEIWLIDDDDGHALLVEESFEEAGLRNKFVRAKDGDEGWLWLQEAARGERARPGLILLDVSMPGLDGFQVLERIKGSPELKQTPVIMLTSTDAPREIERSYRLGCSAYVVKPVDFEHLHQKIRALGLFVQIIEVVEN
jgi:CheY-like chemotaxis protein